MDSAILHANNDLIPGRWNFSLKTVGGGAGDSNRFFRFVWLDAGGVRDVSWDKMYPVLLPTCTEVTGQMDSNFSVQNVCHAQVGTLD